MFGRWLLQGRCGSSLQLDYPEQREAAEPGHPGRVTALQRAARRPTQETASGKESDPSQGRREEQEAASGGQIWSGGSSSTAACSPARRPVTTLREAARETAWRCLGFVALIGLVTEMESREGAMLALSGADRATAWGLGSSTGARNSRGAKTACQGSLFKGNKSLFQNSNCRILEHWLNSILIQV